MSGENNSEFASTVCRHPVNVASAIIYLSNVTVRRRWTGHRSDIDRYIAECMRQSPTSAYLLPAPLCSERRC